MDDLSLDEDAAPKGHELKAQGNALGSTDMNSGTLKGRDLFRPFRASLVFVVPRVVTLGYRILPLRGTRSCQRWNPSRQPGLFLRTRTR